MSANTDNSNVDPCSGVERKLRWSIHVIYFTTFFSSISFSIVLPSIWSYLRTVDPDTDPGFTGWAIACFSLAQFVASPIFGALANARANHSEPLIVSLVITVVGSILYTCAEDFYHNQKWVILAARSCVGIGAGNFALAKSYGAAATTPEQRTSIMAKISGFMAVGIIVGPGLQSVFSLLGYPGSLHYPFLHLNVFTAAGWFGALVAIINIGLVLVLVQEPQGYKELQDTDSNSLGAHSDTTKEDSPKEALLAKVQKKWGPRIVFIFLFAVIFFGLTIYESVAAPMALDNFEWTEQKTVFNVGLVMTGCGVVSVFVFVVIILCSASKTERALLMFGLVLHGLGILLLMPWVPGGRTVCPSKTTESSTVNMSTTLISGNLSFPVEICGGFDQWCPTMPTVSLAQFLSGTLILVVGYAICQPLVFSIFSKNIGSEPQGTMMGWLTGAGALARAAGPAYVNAVYSLCGPRVAFGSTTGVLVLAIILYLLVYRSLT